MRNYNDLLKKIYEEGHHRVGRNGGTKALFAQQLRFNLKDGFPAVTTKKLAFKAVKSELLWFLAMKKANNGRASDLKLRNLNGSDKTIWTANAESDYWKPKSQFDGDLGRVYGIQWRSWKKSDGTNIDQIQNVIDKLKTDPYDRRLIVSAWNPAELDDMALPPCHMMFQFFCDADKNLSLNMIQRSCDMFLGVPFNIASYALLLCMVAQVTELKPGELVLTLNDAHIYDDHSGAVKEQLSREPFPLPKLYINPDVKNIDDFKMDDLELIDYKSHPAIKAKMAV